MFNDFNLTKLPPYGKLFVGLFTFLMLAVFLWATTLATVESGIFGHQESEEYDYQADMETILSDDQAVTAPDWSDSGEQEPIDESNAEEFTEPGEESAWETFEDNLKLSHVHLNGHTALFFGLGAIFLFSTVSPRAKKLSLWIFGVAIFLHAVGLAGLDSCTYGKILSYIGGIPLLSMILFMSLRIFADLRRK